MTLATLDPALELDPRANPIAAPVISDEDLRALTGTLDPSQRLTCPLHLTWIYRCVHAAIHFDPLTGYRWCRRCRQVMTVAFDELTGHATLHCPSCGRGAQTPIDRNLIAACEHSFLAARALRPAA